MSKLIRFTFDGYEPVHEAEEWCFEDTVQAIRWKLSIPYWTEIKPHHDRINLLNITPPKDATLNPSSSDTQEPTPVPKRVRSRKPRS